jgi:BBSome-interacting protein 1
MVESAPTSATTAKGITEVLPRQGLVYSEKSGLAEVLCKPRIMPIKSSSLVRLEAVRKESAAATAATVTAAATGPPVSGTATTTAIKPQLGRPTTTSAASTEAYTAMF